jgi:hypothetical protein
LTCSANLGTLSNVKIILLMKNSSKGSYSHIYTSFLEVLYQQ